MNNQVKIEYSAGRGKYGVRYAYIRPAGDCVNRSRRCAIDKVDATISQHFPVVNYYLIDGLVIGAKNEDFALKEFYRVCHTSKIGSQQTVLTIDPGTLKLNQER